nr:putative polygalacturonase [Quercus suber]
MDFGAVVDGKTSNTKAFNAAIQNLSTYTSDGGAQLLVPPGKWLTGSFNLTSHFTLFLHKDAVILGTQGFTWWKKFRAGEYNVTRPYMIEIMYFDQIQISDLTLINSPSWFVHPIYSSNVLVKGLTILAPVDSPNTDGVNPDSCTNTRIKDCFIVSGDDCVAVKSGSEMSGGIQDVRAEDTTAIDTQSGVRIKTAVGRGAYVKDIYVRRMTLKTMKYVFWMAGNYNQHPDPFFIPKAIPEIKGINFRDVVAENVTYPGSLAGIQGDPFTGICISNATITLTEKPEELLWNCTDIPE